jgi:cytochrome c553
MKTMIKVMAVGTLLASSALYAGVTTKCIGCHGADFGKAALGKSKIVKDMSKEEIVAALKGYQAGTFGGPMKGVMEGQVKGLDDAAIQAIADEIKK